MNALRLGTRGSALALWQAHWVAQMLRDNDGSIPVEIVILKTTGDVRQDIPLPEMAGKGVFVREIEVALLSGNIDLAVHSAKDLQSEDLPGLTLGAFCVRADARDALVSRNGETLADLPQGATIATGSPRRVAQLLHLRPDLRFVSIRGNVDTRLAKLAKGEADALVLACAGLDRLERADVITERISLDVCLPQVGQACVAVQCRENDARTIGFVRASCDHTATRQAVETERAFLALLGGGCSAPVAAHAIWQTGENVLSFTGQIGSPDGTHLHTAKHHESQKAADPVRLARRVFDGLMANPDAQRLMRGLNGATEAP